MMTIYRNVANEGGLIAVGALRRLASNSSLEAGFCTAGMEYLVPPLVSVVAYPRDKSRCMGT